MENREKEKTKTKKIKRKILTQFPLLHKSSEHSLIDFQVVSQTAVSIIYVDPRE